MTRQITSDLCSSVDNLSIKDKYMEDNSVRKLRAYWLTYYSNWAITSIKDSRYILLDGTKNIYEFKGKTDEEIIKLFNDNMNKYVTGELEILLTLVWY